MNATELIERNRTEREVLLQHYRDQRAETERKRRAYQASLPRVEYEPIPQFQPGDLVVRCDEKIMGYDGVRVFVAALPGWVPEARARALGLTGPAVEWI